jgi:TetR/AcrR family transcriptional repressor of nem operon
MGRKKNYDRDTLIMNAMEIFRDNGFNGTSAQMLVEGLGVNRFSIYAEFDNKQGLFETALQRYDEEVIDRNFSPLETPEAGIDEIRALLEFYALASKGPAAGRGCLLCNTAVEFGPVDPGGAGFVQRYFERLSRAFYVSLDNAYNRGELRNSVSPREEADFFTASVLGMFVMIRAKAPPIFIENAAKTAIQHLEGLRKEGTT